jgi:glucose/arabinose dehydrogenase
MSFSVAFARLVALVGAVMIVWRRATTPQPAQAVGLKPTIPVPKSQGALPTLKMPTAKGWIEGHAPTAAPGLKVNAFAAGLKHPRWIEVLPNGDVAVAEALSVAGGVSSVFDFAMQSTMRRAAALGDSPNRITLLRDGDGDGVAEERFVFLENQNQPFGMAHDGSTFYVGNTDALLAFDYSTGATRLSGAGRKLASFKPGGHWTRSLLLSLDRKKIYVGAGSLSNIAELGIDLEEGRACIYEVDIKSASSRIFAGGLRNPVGTAWEPSTGTLWTVVNERDGIGDETPPDYLTHVQDGGFYGWPYSYWGQTVDVRVPQDATLVAKAIQPDYALGGHTASLGLCWLPDGTLPGFGEGMAIGQHGSWNRSTLAGYRVVFVPFAKGKPSGPPRDILWGFLSPDERFSYGRPVGVALAPGGGILVADDVGNVIWRVTGSGGPRP